MAVKPISPNEIKINKVFPDEVISSVNELIVKNAGKSGNKITAIVKRTPLINLIKIKNSNITESYLLEHEFLDIEPIFKEYGWNVIYEYPRKGDNDFDPFFRFESKT